MSVFPFHKSLKAFCALNIFQKKVLFVNGLELVETWVQHTMDRVRVRDHSTHIQADLTEHSKGDFKHFHEPFPWSIAYRAEVYDTSMLCQRLFKMISPSSIKTGFLLDFFWHCSLFNRLLKYRKHKNGCQRDFFQYSITFQPPITFHLFSWHCILSIRLEQYSDV